MESRPIGVRQAILQGLTLTPGILPLSMLFGAMAAQADLSMAAAIAISAFVFSGIAQFAAIAAYQDGASFLAITATAAIILIRYVLLAAAVVDNARQHQASPWQRRLLAMMTVEETYAVQGAWQRRGGRGATGLLAAAGTVMLIWTAGTAIGTIGATALPPLEPWGLDYVLPGLFVGILGLFADTPRRLAAGIGCAAAGAALALTGLTTLAVIIIPPVAAFALGSRHES